MGTVDAGVWRRSMNVLVSGATGFIGSALIPELEGLGHRVVRLSRSKPSAQDTIRWDPVSGVLDPSRLRGLDAVVHLAAENVGDGRWTPAKKRRIMDSRRKGTRLLAETIAGLPEPPGVMVSVSGINYYGSRGNELLREESGPGNGFLARVCQEWERAADPARRAGVRVVHPRFGIVFPQGFSRELLGIKVGIVHPKFEITFGTRGTTLATLPVYKITGGGWIGSGRQFWSLLVAEDVVGVILHALTTDSLQGPVNAVSSSVTAREYIATLNRILHRPTVFPLPAPVARLALGDFAEEQLLASIRVDATKLTDSGYEFRYPELEGAMRHLLEE
jgi:NAD dependent epimerase/dehydratase family enzyme